LEAEVAEYAINAQNLDIAENKLRAGIEQEGFG